MYFEIEISLEKTPTQESNRDKNGIIKERSVIKTWDLILNNILVKK